MASTTCGGPSPAGTTIATCDRRVWSYPIVTVSMASASRPPSTSWKSKSPAWSSKGRARDGSGSRLVAQLTQTIVPRTANVLHRRGKWEFIRRDFQEQRLNVNGETTIAPLQRQQSDGMIEGMTQRNEASSEAGDSRLAVGVMGCGRMGKLHARVYGQMPQVRLVGVYDLEQDNAADVASEYRTRAFGQVDDLLDEVQAVTIAVPTQHHLS